MKKQRMTIYAIAICISIFAPLAGADDEKPAPAPVKLILRFQEGKTYRVQMDMDQSSKVPIGGKTYDQRMSTIFEMSIKVSGVPNSTNKEAVTEYTRVAIKLKTMGRHVGFDSADKDAKKDPMMAGMGSMIGKPFTVVLDKDDRVLEVKGLEAISKAGGNPMTAEFMKKVMNKDKVFQTLGIGVGLKSSLPQDPVKPGDEWPLKSMADISELPFKGKYYFENYGNYQGKEYAVLKMEAESVALESLPENVRKEFEEKQKKSNTRIQSAKVRGKVYWDTVNDCLRASEINQTLVSLMSIPGMGKTLAVPMKQKTVTVVDVE